MYSLLPVRKAKSVVIHMMSVCYAMAVCCSDLPFLNAAAGLEPRTRNEWVIRFDWYGHYQTFSGQFVRPDTFVAFL